MAKKPDPELVKYIEKHLLKGYKLKQVKRRLADVGHPIEAIEDAAQFVLSSKPHLKRRDWKFMIVYGLILIVVLAGLVYFIATKTTEQMEYTETVEQIEKAREFKGMTDIELIKYAASTGDISACKEIESHNTYYACVDRYWERDDCSYERTIGEGVSGCFRSLALSTKDPQKCLKTEDVRACLTELAEEFDDERLCIGSYDCVYNLAVRDKDSEVCDVLSGSQEEHCFDEYAKETGNESVCDSGSLTCSYFFAETDQEKEAFVTGLEEGIAERELNVGVYDILLDLASKNDDVGLCRLLEDFDDGSGFSIELACIINIGLNTGDVNVCNELSDDMDADFCRRAVLSNCTDGQKLCEYFDILD